MNKQTPYPGFAERREAGFNLVELMVVVAVMGLVATFALPAVVQTMTRAKIDTTVNGVTQLMYAARGEAVKRQAPVVVEIDVDGQSLRAFADLEGDKFEFDPTAGAAARTTDFEVATFQLPAEGGNGVYFWNSNGTATDPTLTQSGATDVVTGFTPRNGTATDPVIVFYPDGSMDEAGSFHIGMASGGTQANVFRVEVSPQATAKVTVYKYLQAGDADGGTAGYQRDFVRGDGSGGWAWY